MYRSVPLLVVTDITHVECDMNTVMNEKPESITSGNSNLTMPCYFLYLHGKRLRQCNIDCKHFLAFITVLFPLIGTFVQQPFIHQHFKTSIGDFVFCILFVSYIFLG